jgi:hypothetical protein
LCLQLVAAATFDRESFDRYDITVTCSDSSTTSSSAAASLTGSARLVVVVDDVNDNRPEFAVAEYSIVGTVTENQPIGTPVVRVHAIDRDVGLNAVVVYRLLSSSAESDRNDDFMLDASTGLLTTARMFDREKESTVRVTVMAIDGGEPALSATADVIVYIGDEDDEV